MVPESKGTTFRQHWAQIEKTLGRRPKGAPDEVKLNKEMFYLWNTFAALFSGQPISYTEIKSYSELMNIPFMPYEVDAIIKLDRIMRK